MMYINNNENTKIKICGMRRLEDIEIANELLPDYIGFVFVKGRQRYVSAETAKALKGALDGSIKAVGVFVDESVGTIAQIANDGIIDVIQLHGSEDETYIKSLRTLTGKPIIKCFVVKDNPLTADYENCSANLLLIDAGAGDGKTFDWQLIKNIKRPFFLAGGLNPDNVSAAINTLHPFGVDVSSGVETDGFKDHRKIRAFITNIRK